MTDTRKVTRILHESGWEEKVEADSEKPKGSKFGEWEAE